MTNWHSTCKKVIHSHNINKYKYLFQTMQLTDFDELWAGKKIGKLI